MKRVTDAFIDDPYRGGIGLWKLHMACCRPCVLLLGLTLCITRTAWSAPVSLAIRDSTGAPVPAAVVYLEGSVRGPVGQPASAIIDQRDKVFVPQVTVVQTGTDISFPNSDSVSHHVYSFARPNAFELPLYKGGSRPVIRFDHAGIVTLGCNIHDAMIGYVIVVDTPWFVTASDAGTASFADVPPGAYDVKVWSARLSPAKPVSAGAITVGATAVNQPIGLAQRLRAPPGAGGALAAGDY